MEATARRIRGYAGRDPELREIVVELERQLQEFAAPMMEMNRKDIYARSSYQMRSRMENGTAMKNPNGGGR